MKRVPSIVLVFSLILLAGCAQSVEEITADDSFVGETVTVRGTAQSTLKIGELSGYTLVDENGDAIGVRSERLPAEGDQVTAKGTLKKGLLGIGFYIDTQE